MSASNPNWRDEQERINRVTSEISRRSAFLQAEVGELQADIVEIRKHFWEDVTVNFDDAHEAVETVASIKQQAEVLSERERNHRRAVHQLKTLNRLKQSPYFGRIDFTEEGEHRTEPIYLGIASLMDEQDEEFLVYDWRAPVSSLYYDYSPGPAQYETPAGVITGTMELKRQYMIRDGRLENMFDTGLTIGDELLQEVLGKQANTQMKSIVATIQKEQNQIIRNERARLLIVQGAAGSGKTSAALQRVAYLLYRYRHVLRAEQIVLFSPNPLFNSYIATVLPELGEENMQQTTFQEYLERRLGQTFRLEDPFSQLEYVHTGVNEPAYEARLAGIRFKASLDFLNMVEQYINRLGQTGLCFQDIRFRDRVLITGDQIREQFYLLDPSISIPNRMSLLTEWLIGQLKECARKERRQPWVEEEIELLDKDAYQEAYQELRKRKRLSGNTFDDFALEQRFLATLVVNEQFRPLRTKVNHLAFVDVPAIYRQLFTSSAELLGCDPGNRLPPEWPSICEQTAAALDRRELFYEDATPYLYLKERIEGFHTNTSIRHVFIDEAQDYSPFQFAFLRKLFPHARMTLLGDLNQAIFAHTASEGANFSVPSSSYPDEETETIPLTRSYRSTRPIVEFTRRLIPGGEQIQPFNRDGVKPTVTPAATSTELTEKLKERIQALREAGHRTIAVICKTAQESKEAHRMLGGKLPLHLVSQETLSFQPGILVIPSSLAKGVEFDAVVIYNASHEQYGRESERKLFYTACTRAMHELHLLYTGEMSPFLAALPPDLYTLHN